MVSAYSLGAIVSMALPAAHGDDCRVATTITAGAIAALQVSRAAAGVVSIALWLCPAWALWWTKNTKTDHVTDTLMAVLRWMDENYDMLPSQTHEKEAPPIQDFQEGTG